MCDILVNLLTKFERGMNVNVMPIAISLFKNLRFALFLYEGEASRGFPKLYLDFDLVSDENPHGISLGNFDATSAGRLALERFGSSQKIQADSVLQNRVIAFVIEKSNLLIAPPPELPIELRDLLAEIGAAKESTEVDQHIDFPITHTQRVSGRI